MIAKTKGLVLGFVKFRETSIIVQIYTEAFGRQAYLVNGARSTNKGKASQIAMYQPLTLLALETRQKGNRDIQHIDEAKLLFPYLSITSNARKSAIALFLAEVLAKALREEEGNAQLFDFLAESLYFFDRAPEQYENFHIQFLIGLSNWLGFGLEDPNSLSEELGVQLTDDLVHCLGHFQEKPYTEYLAISGRMRSVLLDLLLRFFKQNLENFGEIKSLSILQEIWGG